MSIGKTHLHGGVNSLGSVVGLLYLEVCSYYIAT